MRTVYGREEVRKAKDCEFWEDEILSYSEISGASVANGHKENQTKFKSWSSVCAGPKNILLGPNNWFSATQKDFFWSSESIFFCGPIIIFLDPKNVFSGARFLGLHYFWALCLNLWDAKHRFFGSECMAHFIYNPFQCCTTFCENKFRVLFEHNIYTSPYICI